MSSLPSVAVAPLPGRRNSFLLLVSITLSTLSMAQIEKTRFEQITMEDGLSSFRVLDVARDREGFMWFGTFEGLDRYDGYKVVSYRHNLKDSLSISQGPVTSLLIDSRGVLWAGTRDGVLNRFDPKEETFVRYPISQRRITCMTEDNRGVLWVGTFGEGIYTLDLGRDGDQKQPGSSSIYGGFRNNAADPHSLQSDSVRTLVPNHEGNIWIGTETGLDLFDHRERAFFRFNDVFGVASDIPMNPVRAILLENDDSFWIGTNSGLVHFNPEGRKFTHYQTISQDSTSLSENQVAAVWGDQSEYLWVGTINGLNRLEKKSGRFKRYWHDPSDPHGLLNNDVRAIDSYGDGIMWIVTDRGINKYVKRSNQFHHFLLNSNSRRIQYVNSIHQASDGSLWIGTLGAWRLKDGKITHFTHDPADPTSISQGFIMAIHEDRKNNLWLGGRGGTLDVLRSRANRFQHFDLWRSDDEISSIICMTEDAEGSLWVGTYGAGLLRIDHTTSHVRRFTSEASNPFSLPNNLVMCLLQTSNGRLFIGTDGGGLCALDQSGSGFVRFGQPSGTDGISVQRVNAIAEGAAGVLWIVGASGLYSLDLQTEKLKAFPLAGVSPTFVSIIEDNRGRLWLGTLQDGLYRFDPKNRQFVQFDQHDGLQSNQFFAAACKDDAGNIFLGGEKGYNEFQPDSVTMNPSPPPIVFTDIRILDKSAKRTLTSLELPYDQNYISFEFAALNFSSPEKSLYAYMLEGIDNSWILSGNRRYASYPHLDPGSYVFRVKASNRDGVWNEQGLALPLTLFPPFWQTAWFKTLLAIALIGILVVAYNYRVSQLLKVERLKIQIASDLHDDIGTALSSIALTTDVVRSQLTPDQDQAHHYLVSSGRVARQSADALKDIVWLIQPRHDSTEDLALRLKDAASKILVGLQHTFTTTGRGAGNPLDMEVRRNVILIF